MDSIIVNKIEYMKDQLKPLSMAKNNSMKVFEQITCRASSSPLLNGNNFFENAGRNRTRISKKISGNNALNSHSQNVSPRAENKRYPA